MTKRSKRTGRGGPNRNQGRKAEPGMDKLVSARYHNDRELAYLMNAKPRDRMIAIMRLFAPLEDDEIQITMRLYPGTNKGRIKSLLNDAVIELDGEDVGIKKWEIR